MSAQVPGGSTRVSAKIIAEPNDFTYRGPSTSQGRGMLGGLITRMGPGSGSVNAKTVSVGVVDLDVNPKADDPAAAEELRSHLTMTDSLLTKWQEAMGDPETVEGVKRFYAQLNSKLAELQKLSEINVGHVKQLVREMIPYNLGLIYKLQLVVTRISPVEFPKSGYSSADDMYHRTVKSKVTYRRLEGTDVKALATQLESIYKGVISNISVVQRGDAWFRHYEIKETVRKDGTRIRTMVTKDHNGNPTLSPVDLDDKAD